ncbi:serine/threonine protein kinase [Colletotrichum truncatum]|uniref:Serine/threonine protein kinase n=1 Tax=Colletotrichum truncatum TaxID=5467 RepID=A0ACC3YH98_COLTU|nr:serine/threonine protein kinase [Colletotrichum truncatum]KAF6792807.1 serine/threonine protein kinase [Colletotrichum truncatum]
MDKTVYLKWFIDKRFDDEKVRLQHGLVLKCLSSENPDPTSPRKRVPRCEPTTFDSLRIEMYPPFISKSKHSGKVSRHVFEARSILPWKILRYSQINSTPTNISSLYGGYGDVQKIVIHPWQHDFHKDLEKMGAESSCFALKRLYASNEKAFDQEVQQLERFGGRHPHIVTLLSTIILQSSQPTYQLLFPLADCDLLGYWELRPQPKDQVALSWVAEQLFGMADALSFIHNPGLKVGDKSLYGRHGDIKPENVLLFKRRDRDTLVLSDLGLTMTHGEQSRSNRPGETIPTSPNYRPPECDIDGKKGHVSRAFDIWTLGCLFLEFLVWIFDGWDGYIKFKERLYSLYINGMVTCLYFEIVRVGERDFAFKVKDVIHESMLNLVETRMLLVRSKEVDRITAQDLRNKLQAIKNDCKSKSYCVDPCPRPSFNQPRLPVRARLNSMAQQYIDRDHINFKDHRGATSSFENI